MESIEQQQQQFEYEQEKLRRKAIAAEKKRKTLLMTLIAVILALVLALVFFFVTVSSKESEITKIQQEKEQLALEYDMLQSANEFARLDSEYAMLENQTQLLANDSLVEKYAAARAQVEKLLAELKNEKNKSAAQIKKLQDEITTLKGILRDFTQQINDLMEENEGLRTENETVKNENQQLNEQVKEVTRSNEKLSERMVLAEKLNVTGLNLVALNKKGKTEKNITKASKLMVTFTIPQNNSTPPGEKTIYMRIISPEGNLLEGNGGTFSFEGATLQASARTTIEYANEEIGGITIYWDVNTALNPGDYRVELFADNYRLASRNFTLRK